MPNKNPWIAHSLKLKDKKHITYKRALETGSATYTKKKDVVATRSKTSSLKKKKRK